MDLNGNKELLKYISELADDVKLSEINLREKSLMTSSIWAKWLSYLYKEKSNIDKIQKLKQDILKKKLSEEKFQDSVLKLKNEEKITESDQNVKNLNILMKITQDNIDYIERALQILSNFGFQIKNVTDVLKLNLK